MGANGIRSVRGGPSKETDMLRRDRCDNERGMALVVVLLVLVAVAAVVSGAAVVGTNASLITKYHERLSVLETAADAGLELPARRSTGTRPSIPIRRSTRSNTAPWYTRRTGRSSQTSSAGCTSGPRG